MAYLMHMMGYGQTEEEKNKESSSEEVVEQPIKKEGIEHPFEKKDENYKGDGLGEKLRSTKLEESTPIEGEEEERQRENIYPQEWCKEAYIKSSEKEGEGKMMGEEGEHQDSSIGGNGKVEEELAMSKSPSYGSKSSEHNKSPENDEFKEPMKMDEFFKAPTKVENDFPREPTKVENELPKEPTKGDEFPKESKVDGFPQQFTNQFPKEPIKADECPNEPTKLEDFPKEPSNLEVFPKEPTEVDYFPKEPTKVDDFQDFPKQPTKVDDFPKEPTKVDDFQDFPREPTKVDDFQDFPKEPTKVQEYPKEEPIEVEEDKINKEEHKATLKEKLMIKVKGDADHDNLKVKLMSKVFGKSPEGNKNKDGLGGA